MIDGVPLDQVGIGSGWAIVVFVAVSVFRGWLIPKATHDREMAQAEAATERAEHDRNEWRAESRIKDQQLAEKDVQLGHMAEVGKTVTSVMRAVQALRKRRLSEDDA